MEPAPESGRPLLRGSGRLTARRAGFYVLRFPLILRMLTSRVVPSKP